MVHPLDVPAVSRHNQTSRQEYQFLLHLAPEPWIGNLEGNLLVLYANPGATLDNLNRVQQTCKLVLDGTSKSFNKHVKINELLIEIKDFHIMHKNQVESGKWDAKMEAIKKMGVKYYFITHNNWNVMLNELKNILKN
jgi:hypothetical protein